MSFEDIDTPVSESELLGDEAIVENDTPVVEESAAEEAPVEEAQEEEVVEDKPAERAPVIPRARFDEVNAKLHAEREENERLRAEIESRNAPQQEQSGSVDIAALEKEAFNATMEGDIERYVALRAQINAQVQANAEAKAAEKIGQEIGERETRNSLNSVAAKAYEAYPFLDVSGEGANEAAINDVIEWRDFYAMKGNPVHVALQMAVNKVGPMYSTAEQAPVAEDTRKQAAIVRNLRDAKQQPPQQSAGVGNRAAPPGPKIDSQDDWDKLNKADRERILMGA